MNQNFPYEKALDYFRGNVDGKGLDNRYLACAIDALEKQIQKKVVKTKDYYYSTCCPNCKFDLYIEDLGTIFKADFCPDCGQAIKYED